jgi:hypothetical protein
LPGTVAGFERITENRFALVATERAGSELY